MSDLRDWVEKVRADFGTLTPRAMVTAARQDGPEGCPIYDRLKFDDDETAAELWRIDEARRVLRELKVVYKEAGARTPERSVRAYHAVSDSGPGQYRYEPVEEIASDPLLRQLVLREMERDWKQLRQRYGHMQEFIRMIADDIRGEEAA